MKYIKELRTKYNLSQKQLAEKLKVSQQVVAKWENNLCLPNSHNLIKIYKIFNVSPNEILNIKNITQPTISLPNREILHMYDMLNQKRKKLLTEFAKELYKAEQAESKKEPK